MEKKEGVYSQNHPQSEDQKAKSVREEQQSKKEPKVKPKKKKAA